MSIFDQARNVLKTLKQGKANPLLQGIYDLPGSTKILAQRAPQAVNQMVMDPRVASNFARNAPKSANIKVPGMQSVANFSANTAQSFGQGLQDMAMGYNKLGSKPGAFNKLQGGAQMIAGAGKTIAPFTLPFQVANSITSVPQTNNMVINPVQRFSAGVLRGMSGDQKLAENVKNKNDINLNLFGTKIGIDPAETAGQMVGFVKNPINKQLFKLTNSVFPTGSLAVKGTNLKKWLAVTSLRGGVENILLDLSKVPENATNEQKISFMLRTAGIGSLSEIGGRGMLDVSGAAGNKVFNNKQVVQAFNELKLTFNKLNIPVATTNIDPTTGKRVTMPMWKYRLDKMGINEKGFIKPDEFLPKPKSAVAASDAALEKMKSGVKFADLTPAEKQAITNTKLETTNEVSQGFKPGERVEADRQSEMYKKSFSQSPSGDAQAGLYDTGDTVTLYRAAPKFPEGGKFKAGDFFSNDPQKAQYYSESHYKGDPQDIKIQQFTFPKDAVRQEGADNIYVLNKEHPYSPQADMVKKVSPDYQSVTYEAKPRVAQPPLNDAPKVRPQIPELQTSKTPTQQSQVLKEPSGAEPQGLTQAGGGTGGSSSSPIVSQKDKYAFNINKPKLGLTGESAKKLDETVAKMRPILETRKGKPLTDKEIITSGRKAKLLETVMGRDDSAKFAEALQASRNFLKSESSKKGLTPEFLAQIEIVSSHASDKGRSLRAFAVGAENAGIKEQVIKDLGKLGISTKRLIDAAKNVDWDNAQQVTEFYRKFKPAGFLEMLEEYRYANMLSSPNTQINNIFSNFLQSGVVTPVEKTLTGSLDFARSRLTGKEQKYFASQGVDYAKGYWGSLPQAWKIFRGVLKGDGGLAKPDIDFIPTGTGKIHKLYTTPLRALEAGDQFFRTLVAGGEIKSLERAGITGVEATNKAEAEATYRVFRQAFDPDGKLGQGGVLKVWDKWNVGINQLRRLPGGKWIVPFLQTPTNILKQGVEYSPIGFSTIPGSKEPMVQLSKALLGSGVFVGAYSLADAGLTTWDTPINKKDKDAFYEAGLQPYSVKIGNKWVSYSKLGPLSYPIAMAAAMKWAKDNGSDESALKTAGAGMGGFLQFFADQSYMQGIGDVIDAVRGDEWKQGRALANIPSQLIPYRAFQGWIARLTDPVYRKVSSNGILEQAVDSIKSQTPFASKTLDPYTNSKGDESRRSNPLINSISPFKISQETSPYMPKSTKAIYYEFAKLETQQEKAALWGQMVKDKRITKDNISDLKQHFLDEKLKLTDRDIDIRNEGVADGSRTKSIYNEFNKLKTAKEKAELWNKYVEGKIITKDVAKQLKMLMERN